MPAEVAGPPVAAPAAPWLILPPDPALRGRADAVYFTGDSLTFDTWHWGGLARRAASKGWGVSGVRARGGITAEGLVAGWGALSENLPGVVLIAVGANDVIVDTPPRAFARSVNALVRAAPGRRVVLVGIALRSDPLVAAREEALNAVLHRIARRSPRVTFADWAAVMQRHPEWSLPNDPFGVHLTDSGLRGRARFYVRSLGSPG